jgi:hypothetical protein
MDSHQSPAAITRESPISTRQNALRATWQGWARLLQRRHLADLAALLLDAGGPLALVSAQILHMGEPLLGPRAALLAELLESDEEINSFASYLRQGMDEVPEAGRGAS